MVTAFHFTLEIVKWEVLLKQLTFVQVLRPKAEFLNGFAIFWHKKVVHFSARLFSINICYFICFCAATIYLRNWCRM